jgi:hypothetical protein
MPSALGLTLDGCDFYTKDGELYPRTNWVSLKGAGDVAQLVDLLPRM